LIQGPVQFRTRPATEGESMLLEDPVLPTGQKLFVADGPVPGSGQEWYLVNAIDSGWFQVGWVAAVDRDGTQLLEPSTMTCPKNPSFPELRDMFPTVRLYCYGSRDFEFTQRIFVGPMCGDGNSLGGPEWMNGCYSVFALGDPGALMHLAVKPRLAGALGEIEWEESFSVKVTAHLDDPAAQTCSLVSGWEGEIDYVIANPAYVLQCRTMFVATALELAP
jgi:hypothetical protein